MRGKGEEVQGRSFERGRAEGGRAERDTAERGRAYSSVE